MYYVVFPNLVCPRATLIHVSGESGNPVWEITSQPLARRRPGVSRSASHTGLGRCLDRSQAELASPIGRILCRPPHVGEGSTEHQGRGIPAEGSAISFQKYLARVCWTSPSSLEMGSWRSWTFTCSFPRAHSHPASRPAIQPSSCPASLPDSQPPSAGLPGTILPGTTRPFFMSTSPSWVPGPHPFSQCHPALGARIANSCLPKISQEISLNWKISGRWH